ncbi:DUF1680 family protein [Chitinophaga sp. YR627]|uniref:glycoside hydrolase family 127 protein n=1 Tax=Chitinophaga sp. YR627 TaxID=1881041 RepID=UPI0008E9BCC7|nr:beta-L-arabinofuranosidase domain-containing protein [Chitinophaga sp. YR627]SFM57660.1 DUF1680 family protein [Chitinophaga sp. YR627]
MQARSTMQILRNIHTIKVFSLSALLAGSIAAYGQPTTPTAHIIQPADLSQVKIKDAFWTPKYKVWTTHTVYDVLDKLEGSYDPDRQDLIDEKKRQGKTRNAFLNFDRVAFGEKNTQVFDGPPWYDGLVYETIRGAADLLSQYPDKKLEKKLDAYIERIAAAQAADPDGYINTYTTLNRPGQRWGTNGGDDKWQHDVYNAGALIEAAVHYYQATGKTRLLNVAVKMSNYMYAQMGPAPKLNVIPGHGGPEEALLKLYWLFKTDPALKAKISVSVHEEQYYSLVQFWIENRGNYGSGSYARKSDGAYNQDHLPVLQQQTIEGHAVRATLLATGVTAMAMENNNPAYFTTAVHYWDNMTGKRMFVTGGEGAIADQEKFGPDYFLPESAYLETCASIGAAFFSQRMNQLLADGKYMDEFERVLYNNLLSGLSLSGDHYFYENPLIAKDHKRWAWHSCPCCPPMILKMVAAIPEYIYAADKTGLYVNLFIGSEYKGAVGDKKVSLKQSTQYPWKGTTQIEVNPAQEGDFAISVRIPGWAQGKENYFDLYTSQVTTPVALSINGIAVPVQPVKGYVSIQRRWKKGDKITLELPMQPRLIFPHDSVETVRGKATIAAGPVIYGLEGIDNSGLDSLVVSRNTPLQLVFKPGFLGGVNVVTGREGGSTFTAIPFYTLANRQVAPYRVWLPLEKAD